MKQVQHSERRSGKYKVTALSCATCQHLGADRSAPAIEIRYAGRQTEPEKQPIHNWYIFTLSYSPQFVEYELSKSTKREKEVVLDPFVGTGTTLVQCKLAGTDSVGIDANDFLVFVSRAKTMWNVDLASLREAASRIERSALADTRKHRWSGLNRSIVEFIEECRDLMPVDVQPPKLLREGYISPKPLARLLILKKAINSQADDGNGVIDLTRLGFAWTLVPSSNVRFGPGFGLIPPVEDVDVIGLFRNKMKRIIADLEWVQKQNLPPAQAAALSGDTRNLSAFLQNRGITRVITSPPYPGDHEYTRHTRLELVLLDYVKSVQDIREIKKRMVRGSTRSTYSTDNDRDCVMKFPAISGLMQKIESRVRETNGTSGFEKLYGRLVGEYFGGMYRSLAEIHKVLEPRGIVSLLVGDSHAFKMVHIETAKLLGEIALDIGYSHFEIELWQDKRSSAHDFLIPENILRLHK